MSIDIKLSPMNQTYSSGFFSGRSKLEAVCACAIGLVLVGGAIAMAADILRSGSLAFALGLCMILSSRSVFIKGEGVLGE